MLADYFIYMGMSLVVGLIAPSLCFLPDQLEETNEPGQPHEALYLVVAYLQLFELLSVREVCRSLRDVVDNDVLLWLDIVVEQPLNLRLSDNILMKITSKAHGRLRSLALMNCVRITDDGLQRIVEINPHINKVCRELITRSSFFFFSLYLVVIDQSAWLDF